MKISTKYPVIKLDDLLEMSRSSKKFIFSLLSVDSIQFEACGFWTISGVDKDCLPEYKYNLIRLNDNHHFDHEQECSDIEESQFCMTLVKDFSDHQHKVLILPEEVMETLYSLDPSSYYFTLDIDLPDTVPLVEQLKARYYRFTPETVKLKEELCSFVESNVNLRKFMNTHAPKTSLSSYKRMRLEHSADYSLLHTVSPEGIRMN